MESESGAKIAIRGKGSVKEGKGRSDAAHASNQEEDLHCLIMADTEEKVNKAKALIHNVIETAASIPEGQNELKRNQLRELAALNGTLRDDENQACQNCKRGSFALCNIVNQPIGGEIGHRKYDCPQRQNFTANIICRICGNAGHMARDCPDRQRGTDMRNTLPGGFNGPQRRLGPADAVDREMEVSCVLFFGLARLLMIYRILCKNSLEILQGVIWVASRPARECMIKITTMEANRMSNLGNDKQPVLQPLGNATEVTETDTDANKVVLCLRGPRIETITVADTDRRQEPILPRGSSSLHQADMDMEVTPAVTRITMPMELHHLGFPPGSSNIRHRLRVMHLHRLRRAALLLLRRMVILVMTIRLRLPHLLKQQCLRNESSAPNGSPTDQGQGSWVGGKCAQKARRQIERFAWDTLNLC